MFEPFVHVALQHVERDGAGAEDEVVELAHVEAFAEVGLGAGAEFLERYWGITDTVTRVDPARHYHVRQATQHPVNEHARVTRFAEILSGADAASRAAELGELM